MRCDHGCDGGGLDVFEVSGFYGQFCGLRFGVGGLALVWCPMLGDSLSIQPSRWTYTSSLSLNLFFFDICLDLAACISWLLHDGVAWCFFLGRGIGVEFAS